jgi:type II secretory pathway component PulF
MRLAYRAFDRSGREVSDVFEAPGLAEAADQLRKQGLFVVELIERHALMERSSKRAVEAGTGGAAAKLFAGGRTARLKEVTGFFRQLSVLVATGTPMVDALAAVERQTPEGRWRRTLADVRKRVEEGSSLGEAMGPHPAHFDAVCRSLICAGESGGSIDEMLRRLTMLTRQQLKVRSSVTGAMVYPCLLLCVCVGVLGVMMGFVLPRFEGLFETLGAPLPPTTKLLMDLSGFCREYWWAVIGAVIAVVFGIKAWLASRMGRVWLHKTVLRLPIFGRVFRNFATARVARVLGVLLEGRVPLLEALQLTRRSTGNLCYEDLVLQAEEEVTRGGNISGAFAGSPLISQAVTEAIRSGEKTGQIGPVMVNIAEFMEEDNEIVLRSLTSLIEPVILITLGLLVGFVAVSMFLPLFDLATTAHSAG